MTAVALATLAAARPLDDDLAPLEKALQHAGYDVSLVDWDDPQADWSQFDAVLLRSTWDYTERPSEFLAWCERVAAQTRLFNPLDVVRWNTDKHYLADLQNAGVAIVESVFLSPEHAANDFPDYAEFVVKPCISAGSKDTQRYVREERDKAIAHIARLQAEARSVLIQPYLAEVDDAGETALIFFNGVFSHAIRKGPLLLRGADATNALFAAEDIRPRLPNAQEHALAAKVLECIPQAPLLYARIDLLPSAQGPRLLELELTEPSLFFATSEGAVERLVAALEHRLRN